MSLFGKISVCDQRKFLGLLIITLHSGFSVDSVQLSSRLDRSDQDSEKPRIISSPHRYQEPQGAEVVLKCEVTALGENNVVWKQGERIISAGSIMTRVDPRLSLTELYSSHRTNLRIKKLKLRDAGNYTCELEWSGRPMSVSHSLTILQPPAISSPRPGSHYHLDQGGQFSINCIAGGDPQPQVWWSQRKERTLERIKEGRGGRREEEEEVEPSILQLSPLSRNMSGTYVCLARNSVGTAEVNIVLAVKYAPEVIPARYRVYSGEGLSPSLECNVTGYPEPVVTWHYIRGGHRGLEAEVRQDGGHLVSREGNRHRLVIRHLQYSHITNFTCRAENEIGVTEGHIEITGVPQPPLVLSSPTSSQATSYTLVFTVESFQPLTWVEVKLWPQQDQRNRANNLSDQFIEKRFKPGNLRFRTEQTTAYNITYHIDQLNRTTSYLLLITAMNKYLKFKTDKFYSMNCCRYGWSDQSKIFKFRTLSSDYSHFTPTSIFDFHSGGNGVVLEKILEVVIFIHYVVICRGNW